MNCGPVPVIKNAVIFEHNTAVTGYNSTYTYQCLGGTRFDDGSVMIEMRCNAVGTWDHGEYTCESEWLTLGHGDQVIRYN